MTICYEYPIEEDLAAVRNLADVGALAADGVGPLIDKIRALWWYPDMLISWTPETGALELHTGGWSGNETIIDVLEKTVFWWVAWKKIERGGHFYLEIPAFWNRHVEVRA